MGNLKISSAINFILLKLPHLNTGHGIRLLNPLSPHTESIWQLVTLTLSNVAIQYVLKAAIRDAQQQARGN